MERSLSPKLIQFTVTETPDGPTFVTASLSDATEDSAYNQTVTVADEDPGVFYNYDRINFKSPPVG